MQIHGFDTDPTKAAQAACDTYVVNQAREDCQLLSTALHVLGAPLTGTIDARRHGEGMRKPYAPMSKNHPLTWWVAGARCHFRWVLAHGLALCEEYARRAVPYEDGTRKEHLCVLFLRHIQEHIEQHGFPDNMPETRTPDEWLDFVGEHKPEKRDDWVSRIVTLNVPDGCQFGLVALLDFTASVPNDWTLAYHEYNEHKRKEWAARETRPIIMTWSDTGKLGAKPESKKRAREERASHEEAVVV